MNRLGSDVVALAAILGSGAVGGVVTLAALERGSQTAAEECFAASAMPAPRIVVESGHGSHSIVVAPRLHVRATHGCGVVVVDQLVQEELDRALADLDESRVKLEQVYGQELEKRLNEEMARLEIDLKRLGEEAGR